MLNDIELAHLEDITLNLPELNKRAVAEIRALRARIDELEQGIEAALDKHRCGDNSCMFGHRGGMATNGGCGTSKEREALTLRRILQEFAGDIRRVVRPMPRRK